MAVLMLLLVLLVPGAVLAQESGKAATVVRGDVMYWEGEELIVKEMSGREVRMHVNAETKIEGVASKLKTGDKIEAAVNADGHATSIRLQLPDGGTAAPPGIR